jgi:TonB-dependent SusC/RagA subfamily outer membrane receptor
MIPSSYLANNEKQQEELNKLGLGKGKMIKEVKIRAVKLDDKYETQSFAGAGHADQVMHSKDIEKIGGQLSTSLSGRLRVPFYYSAFAVTTPLLVVVDGFEEDPDFNINEIPSSQVETIEVLKGANASIYGMRGGRGVLVITTKRGGSTTEKDVTSVGILPIAVQGYYKAREFYSPKYDHTEMDTRKPDLRSTIYWNPELATDKDGNASFDYYNADSKGSYRMVVEGIDEKGNIGRQVYRYKVE